jgi:hypothetical protein
MSGGMEDANATGILSRNLEDAAHEMRDAVKDAEAGHRGIAIAVEDTVNPILLSIGWKLVRAEKFTGYR